MTSYHDWTRDHRAFSTCLNEWMQANGYQNSQQAAEALGVNHTTLHSWRWGRPCSYERTLRKLMTALDRLPV